CRLVVLTAAEDLLAKLRAGVESRALSDIPVHAEDVVAAQLLGVAGELIVVIALRDRIPYQVRIGQREQVEDLPAHRTDHLLRNDVAGEAPWTAGVHVARER